MAGQSKERHRVKLQAKATSAGSIDGSGKSRGLLIAALAVVASLAFGASTAFAASPTVTIDPGPTAQYTTAQVSGTVDPEGGLVFYEIEYSTDQVNWSGLTFSHTAEDADPSDPAQPVSQEFTGLQPGTQYWFRVYATNFADPDAISSEVTATTEPVAIPTATLDPVTTHTATTAHLSGTVQTNAPAGPLSPAAEDAFKADWHFECTPECPGLSGGTVEASEASKAVSVDATGLEPNTTYEVRLVASNAGGPSTDAKSFATDEIVPGVKAAPGAPDGKAGYTLQGVVNPHNSAITSCEFEYGLTSAYGKSVPCTTNPGVVNKGVEVTAHLSGLNVGANYHFNLVASNGAGTEESGDATFSPSQDPASPACPNEAIREEQASTFLPECRGYELVTSPFKEGFAPVNAPRYADDAVAYQSLGAFAGAGLGQQSNQYVARRTVGGWLTTSPNPSGPDFQADISGGAEALSADLSRALWLMRRADQSTDEVDYYLRGPDGTFTRVGPAIDPTTRPPGAPGTAGPVQGPDAIPLASDDLSHVVFTTSPSVGFDGGNLFEYVGTGNERPKLVGVDNTGQLVNPGGTCAGGMSNDGRVVFFVPGCEGSIWARINGTTSIKVSASECTRTVGDPGGACTGLENASFAGKAADGSRAFVITSQQLVNGDTDETPDLYACDIPPGTPAPEGTFNHCASLTRISGPGQGADVQAAIRVSGDGSHVYFIARGILAGNPGSNGASAVAGDRNLYVWQTDAAHPGGQTTFIGKIEGDVFADFTATTPEGRYFVISTASQLVPADTDTAPDVYRYDSATGALVRVSTAATGTGGNDSAFEALATGRSISADGQTIVFTTAEQLSPGDTDAVKDVYLWHAGRVSRVSDGGGENPVIAASGRDVFFRTARPLTAADGDTNFDLYDARIDGGFSFARTAPCSGEACQGSVSGPPSSRPPSTEGTGPGNPSPPRPCPKGKVRKHGKCVKKPGKHSSKQHHGNKGSHNRGGGK
jgi:hypothetical protein